MASGVPLMTRRGLGLNRVCRSQGTTSAEAQAVTAVRADAEGTTAYLNLEPGDVHGDDSAVQALLQAGVARVVIGEPELSLSLIRCALAVAIYFGP